MSDTTGAPSGREYGRLVFVCGCVLALVLSAALLPMLTASSTSAPVESLFPTNHGSGSDGSGENTLGALNPGRKTTVGGIDGGESQSLRSQSAAVHFVVQSTESAYWRTGAYTTYTGDGWRRPTGTTDYDGQLETDGLLDQTVSYRVTLNRSATALPTVWRPQRIDADGQLSITDQRAVRSATPLEAGSSYRATSVTPPRDPAILAAAGRDYPPAIAKRYTQLPTSMPVTLTGFTDRLTSDADTPYRTARRIEHWLEANKTYSLNVSRPSGDHVASDFVFSMDRGYCEYFATSMVVMLRTQGIPARYVVGYSTGQQVGRDTYVVRGMNAHAWVEVYFPDVGWVRFDPTPGQARLDAEQRALQRQRPDAGSYDHTEQGSPGETFHPSDAGNTDPRQTNATPGTVVPSTPSTPRTPVGSPSKTDPIQRPGDARGERGSGEQPATDKRVYNVTLSNQPVPGSNVTVTVRQNGSREYGVTVLFNGEVIGETDWAGRVTGRVPYAETLNVTVRERTVTIHRPPQNLDNGSGRTPPSAAIESPGYLYAGQPLALGGGGRASTAEQVNYTTESRTYDVATDATLSLSGTIATGQSVVLTATIDGRPIRYATVRLNGTAIGRTDDTGRLSVQLPSDPGNATLTVLRSPVTGNRTITLHSLDLDVESRLPLALPWTGVSVTARLGDKPVANTPVFVDGEQVGTTGINGTYRTTLPLADSISFSIGEYGQRATTTVDGLWRNLILLLGGIVSVVVGSVVVVRRREQSVGELLDSLLDGLLSLPNRLVAALVGATDALVRLSEWLRASVRQGIDALGMYLSGERSPAELRNRFDAWLADAVDGVRATIGLRSSAPASQRAGGDRSDSYVTIREGWDQFLGTVSIHEPETKTPGELANHAVERDGLPRDAVERLRDAFRDVEYGDAAPTERRQTVERAVERIQQTIRERAAEREE